MHGIFFERGCIVVNLSKRAKIHFFSQVLWQKGTCVCVRRESALCEESCVSMSMLWSNFGLHNFIFAVHLWTQDGCRLICPFRSFLMYLWLWVRCSQWIVVSLPRTIGRRDCRDGDSGSVSFQPPPILGYRGSKPRVKKKSHSKQENPC